MQEMAIYDDAAAASVSLKGNAGVRFGFNVGAMFDINDKFTVGVSYRSKVTAKVKEGDIALKYANEEHFTQLVNQINYENPGAKARMFRAIVNGLINPKCPPVKKM